MSRSRLSLREAEAARLAGASPRKTEVVAAAAPAVSAPAKPAAHARHQVRIIGGQWRRSLLPVADHPGLRPTPDRVRETLFNWLGQDLSSWRVLDAFAGSGALGFEAASRGAAQVQLLEQDPALVKLLDASRQRLKAQAMRILRSDALSWMRTAPSASFELVLLDPPFDSPVLPAAMQAAMRLLVPGGWLYVETGQPELPELPAGWRVWRSSRAGAVHFHLLAAPSPAADGGQEP